MHWLRKIIAASHHDCRLQDYLTFGPHQIFDWVEFAKPGTLCIYGGSAKRVVAMHKGLPTGELHDLDLVIFSDLNNGPAIKCTFENRLGVNSFRTLKTPGSKKAFGYQLKCDALGETHTQCSLTIYVDNPPQPTFDDIAHSRILTLKPFHTWFQYPDAGLAEHMLESKRLYSPPECVVYNQCARVAMRETKGWIVHNSEMDRRIFDSSGPLYLNETGHETFIRDLHTIFEGHFPKKNPKAYAKLVYFLFARLQRHGQDFEKLNTLWDKISQHLLERPLTRNLFPPNTQTIAFQTIAKLADQPEIPTDTISTHCSDLTLLREAWASCLTDVGRGHILTDTTSVILTMLSSPQKWKDSKAYVAQLYDTIHAIPDLLKNPSVSDGILTFLMLNLDRPVKPDRFNPLLGRCLPKISPSMESKLPTLQTCFLGHREETFDPHVTPYLLTKVVRQKDSLPDLSSVLAGLHNLLRNNDCFGPDTLSRDEIDNFAWNTFSSASWLKDTPLLTLLDIESHFLENTPSLHLSRFKTILNHKPLSTIERKHVLKEWALLCTNTPDDPDLFLGHAQQVFVDKPALLSDLEDVVWNCTLAVKVKSTYLDIIIPTAITQLDKSPQDWLKVFGLTTDRSFSSLSNIAEALLRNRPRFEGPLPPPKAIIQLLQLHVIPNLSLNTVPLAMKFCSDAVAEYAEKKEDLAIVFSQRLSQLEHLCSEASALFLIRCSETTPFSDHSEGFIRVAFNLDWTSLSNHVVFTLCKKIIGFPSTFSSCELISKLGITHIKTLTVTQAKSVTAFLFDTDHYSNDHRLATHQMITHHPHKMKLLSDSQVSVFLESEWVFGNPESFTHSLQDIFKSHPHTYWPILRTLGDKYPGLISLLQSLHNDTFLMTACTGLSKTFCDNPFPMAWIPFLNDAVEKNPQRKNLFNTYFEYLYSKSTAKPASPFADSAPALKKAWIEFKAQRKQRLSQEKEAHYAAIKEDFATLFKSLRELSDNSPLSVSARTAEEIKNRFLSIADTSLQGELLDEQFSIGKEKMAGIYQIAYFTQDSAFLDYILSHFRQTKPNLIPSNHTSLLLHPIKSDNPDFLNFMFSRNISPNSFIPLENYGKTSLMDCAIQLKAWNCVKVISEQPSLEIESEKTLHSPLVKLALSGQQACLESLVATHACSKTNEALKKRMESLFTLFAESQRVFSTDRTQSESVSNAIKWLHAEGLIRFNIPITLAFTPQPLYPLGIALIFEGNGTATWDPQFGLSSILYQLGAEFNHPEAKPNLLSIYSILKKKRENVPFQGYLSRQIVEAFPLFSPNELSLFLSNALFQKDEDLTLSAVKTVHEFFGPSIISDPSSYCFLTNVISKFPNFLKPVEFLLEHGYTFESESAGPFKPCHYALKYSPIKVFQQLVTRFRLPIHYEIPIGTFSLSDRTLELNLLECLMALSKPDMHLQIHVVSAKTMAVRQLLPTTTTGIQPIRDKEIKESFLKTIGLRLRPENESYVLTLQLGAPSVLDQLM